MKTPTQYLKKAQYISLVILILSFALTVSAGQEPSGSADPDRITWEVAPEVSWYKYSEPGLMENKGVMFGVNASLIYRELQSNIPDDKDGIMLRGDARYSYGKVDYDGALWDGTPYQDQDIDDNVLEFRALVGYDFENRVARATPYFGAGYRYLRDDSSDDPYGYERISQYVYVPLGIEILFASESNWSLGTTFEFDILMWGRQRSHIDAPYGTITNPQHEGSGFRASIRLQKKTSGADFGIEPFVRLWNIEDSDMSEGGLEPKNRTTEVGLRLVWAF